MRAVAKLMTPEESETQYTSSKDRREEAFKGFLFADDVIVLEHGPQLLGMISDPHAANLQIESLFPVYLPAREGL